MGGGGRTFLGAMGFHIFVFVILWGGWDGGFTMHWGGIIQVRYGLCIGSQKKQANDSPESGDSVLKEDPEPETNPR